MKAMLYLDNNENPVAILDEVSIVTYNDNHTAAPVRITYKSRKFNAAKAMTELHRDERMALKLDDGRQAAVVVQHASLDMEGNAVGVLRVLGDLSA